MTKAYVLAEITVTDPESYEAYKAASGAALAKHGGRFLVRGGAVDALEGSRPTTRIVLMEFADADAARAWYESADYTAARELRRHAATASLLLLEGTEA